MAGRVGSRLDKGLGLASVEKPQRSSKAGLYGSRGGRGGSTGGANYPSVLEAYNRDSDYKRWRAGLDYWQGSGKSWGDLQRDYRIRPFRDFGTIPGEQLLTATLFPTGSSPDGAWTVVTRSRGALVLPQPLTAGMVSYDLAKPRPSEHRLVVDVSGMLSPQQLQEWRALIGDQFEDSATVLADGLISHPRILSAYPLDSVAYTLVEVDSDNGRLLFDLSRPFARRRPDAMKPRAFWRRIAYDGLRPLPWRTDGSRLLCSSHRFYCSCPDFSGSRVADLIGGIAGSQQMFPRPAAGRSVQNQWEGQGSGYRSRWRDLPDRSDQRRECKHIHAVRWSLEVPFYEPSDYAVGSDEAAFVKGGSGRLTSAEVFRYHGRRQATFDSLVVPLADNSRVKPEPGENVSLNPEVPLQPDRLPVLWTSSREPDGYRSRADDWWLQPGTQVLKVYDPVVGRYVTERLAGGAIVPVIEGLADG
jgi:hypothetical protein